MSRLSAAMLTTWFVLLGATASGFACAAATGNCCPDGGSMPCVDGDPAAPSAAPEVCCAHAPSPDPAASISPVRIQCEALTVSGSPDLPIASSPTLRLALSAVRRDGAFFVPSTAVRDGSSTYLRTLRLRL